MQSWGNESLTISDTIQTYPCACVGPKNGEPYCPCQMRNVVKITETPGKKILLQKVFEDGRMLIFQSFSTIRKNSEDLSMI